MNKLSNVHITTGSGKLQGFPSVNVSSLENEFCKIASQVKGSICSSCYSNRLSKMRKNLEIRLLGNSALLSERILIESEIPTFNNRYVRFNSYGELINKTHMINLLNIARKNPYTTFGLWTKRADIVMEFNKESNIKYIFSVSKVDGKCSNKRVLDYFDKVFIAMSSAEGTNCTTNCMSCMLCYTDNAVTVIKEKKK